MPFCWFCHEAAQFFCRIRTEPITAKSFQDQPIRFEVLDDQNKKSTFFNINADRKLYALQKLDYENPDHRSFQLTIRATEDTTSYISSVDVSSCTTQVLLNQQNRRTPEREVGGFETYRRRVVSLSKTLYSPKVLVNYPGSGGSVPA